MKSSRSPSARERAAVRARQVLEHPLLALGVEEADPARLLVRLDLRDELQPLVEGVDDRAVGVGDLLAELRDDGVVCLVLMACLATERTRVSRSRGS